MVESAVIVGSILLAFGIDAWWNERSDNVRLAAALKNAVAEVSVGRSEIEGAVGRNRARIAGMRRFLSLSPNELAILKPDSLVRIGKSFTPPSPFDPGGSALESLLLGGNLDIVKNDELATALLDWARFPDEIDDDHHVATELALLFLERSARHGIVLALYSGDSDHAVPGAATLSEALASLRRDVAAVEAVAQLLDEYLDFTDQLAEGLTLADRVMQASLE